MTIYSSRDCKDRLFEKVLVTFSIFLIVFNPYTIFGNPALLVSIIFIFIALKSGYYKVHSSFNLACFSILISIGLWGAIVSYSNGIGQLLHPYSVVSLFFMYLTALGLLHFCWKIDLSFELFLKFLLLALAINNIVIIFEVVFPSLRSLVEGFLVPTGNRDWSKGFRYRGLSAGGGARLSLLAPFCLIIGMHLYLKKYISLFFFSIVVLISFCANIFVGRTGLLLSVLGCLFYFVFMLVDHKSNVVSLFRFLVKCSLLLSLILSVFVLFFYDVILGKFGFGFWEYAVGWLLGGAEGIREEGTFAVILKYLSVIPYTFPEVITGFGFYGGSSFSPWTDSGYSRTFLSVGFPLGILFYVVLFFFLISNIQPRDRVLVFSLLAVLLVAECKEQLLFSGNAARAYMLILVFSRMDEWRSRNFGRLERSFNHS